MPKLKDSRSIQNMDDKYNGLETSEQQSENKLDVGSSSAISYPGEVEMAAALAPLDGVSKLLGR